MATARDHHYDTRSALDACIVVAGLAPAMQKVDGYQGRAHAVGGGMATARDRHYYTRYAVPACIVVSILQSMQTFSNKRWSHERMYLVNDWVSADRVSGYLGRVDRIPHRKEGEAVLLDLVPRTVKRILDIGTGDGRLLALLKVERPTAHGVGLDFSPPMLQAVWERFKEDSTIDIVEHNLEFPLPALGQFDAAVSSFAIHHLTDARKQALYVEVFAALEPGGIFCNLEHVSSPTAALHDQFLQAINYTPESEDPANKLLDVETQLRWLREIGFTDVDCLWKWREFALLVGIKPR